MIDSINFWLQKGWNDGEFNIYNKYQAPINYRSYYLIGWYSQLESLKAELLEQGTEIPEGSVL